MTKIYGLFDPRNSELRYIGKTIEELKKRFKNHLYEANKSNHPRKNAWIRSVLLSRLKPEIVLLDSVEDWRFWEQWYIEYFKGLGCRLTNTTLGGDNGRLFQIPFSQKEYSRKWRLENKDRIRRYYQENKLAFRERQLKRLQKRKQILS